MDEVLVPVITPTDRFDEVGKLYCIGAEAGITNLVRPVRPVTAENPTPDLESTLWPPTYIPSHEIEKAFGIPATVRERQGEQFELFIARRAA